MYFMTPGPLNYAEAELRLRMAKAFGLARDGERGASAIEWVVISAVMIIIAGALGTILYKKITEKAGGLSLDPAVGP